MFEQEKATALASAEAECEKREVKLLFLYLAGSIAYGTNTPESDVDVRGVYMDRAETLLGMDAPDKSFKLPVYDAILHPLKKVTRMLVQCNPNIIEMLGIRDECVIYCDPVFRKMIDSAEMFLSRTRLSRATLGFVSSETGDIYTKSVSPEKASKKMSHILRLLYMSTQILKEGRVEAYRRGEQETLLAIRKGEYVNQFGYPSQEYEMLFKNAKVMFTNALATSLLPNEPDLDKINNFLVKIYLDEYFKEKNV